MNKMWGRIVFWIVLFIMLVFLDRGLPVRAGNVPEVISAGISGTYQYGQLIYINDDSVLKATVKDYSTISVNDIHVYARIYKNDDYYRTVEMHMQSTDQFSIPLTFLDEGTYSFILYVKDGYILISDNDYELNGNGNGYIADNNGPVVNMGIGKGTYFDGTDYYVGASASINGISANISVADGVSGNEAGLSKLSVSLNNTTINADYSGNAIVKTFGGGQYEYGTVSVNTLQIQDYLDSLSVNTFRYSLYVACEDKLGNKCERNINILMDVTSPQITNISVDGADIRGDFECFVCICDSSSKEITVYASDATSGGIGYESGVAKIYAKFIGTDGEVNEYCYTVSDNVAIIKTPGSSFRGRVEVYAVDFVGNTSTTIGTKGIICESQNVHNNSEHISVTMPETSYRTKTGGLLYDGSVEINVTVTDDYSGISSISVSSMTVTACDDECYGTYSDMHSDNTGIFRSKVKDKGLITKAEGTFRINTECNDITVYITIRDNAGNTSKKEVNLSIDKTKPTIVTELVNTESDELYSNYYNNNQYMKLTISDRNFDEKGVCLAVCEGGDTVSVNGFTYKGVDDYGIETYEVTVPFSEDGEYDIYINSVDLAGNSNEGKRAEYFVIDKTPPVITVTYNEPDGIENYYREERVLYLNIKETNFTQYRVDCVKDTNSSYFSSFYDWTDTGINHNSEIVFDKTGTYSFDIEVTDMAGNVSTIEIPIFVIDLEKPEILFYGVEDDGTYSKEITPKVYISDSYYDPDTLKISLTGVRTGYEGTYESTDVSNKGETVSMSSIPVSDIFSDNLDDVYTLSVSSTDKAGNEENVILYFAINCLGSIYEIPNDVGEMNYSYINEENGITITEINPDTIKSADVNIILYKDGMPITLTQGIDYVINKNEKDGEYKEYEYEIDSENFIDDGVYELEIISTDKAGNENSNLNEERGGMVRFAVDNTAPVILVLNVISDTRYETSEKTLEFYCFDKYGLSDIEVYLDDIEAPVTYSEEKDVYELKLYESGEPRNICIVAKDYAGNISEINITNVRVLQEWYIRFWNNQRLRYGSIIGVLVLIMLTTRTIWQIKGKRVFIRRKY